MNKLEESFKKGTRAQAIAIQLWTVVSLINRRKSGRIGRERKRKVRIVLFLLFHEDRSMAGGWQSTNYSKFSSGKRKYRTNRLDGTNDQRFPCFALFRPIQRLCFVQSPTTQGLIEKLNGHCPPEEPTTPRRAWLYCACDSRRLQCSAWCPATHRP